MKLGLDCYFFKFPPGSYVPKHKDPSKFGKQYRLNFVFWDTDFSDYCHIGGRFHCKKFVFNLFDRIYMFRADSEYHKLSMVAQGTQYILSFGFFIK